MNILIDLYQQRRIGEAVNTAEAAKDATRTLQHEVDDLKRKTDALTIACQALWELLRARTGMDDEMILQQMQEIDLRDGKLDGKIHKKAVRCGRCHRTTNGARKNCLYCGSPIPGGHVFQKV